MNIVFFKKQVFGKHYRLKKAQNAYFKFVSYGLDRLFPQKFQKIGELMPKKHFWRNFWVSQEEGNETKEFQGRQVRKDEAPKMR